MQTPPPVLVLDLLQPERALFLELLADLDDAAWSRPTGCPGWSVKDVALHLLGDDLGVLSRRRDGFAAFNPGPDEDVVSFVNGLNADWVRATRRLSPRILRDLLRTTGVETHAHWATLDPFEPSESVSWVGPDPAPAWLAIAREYTERWVHHQQIREALAAPPLLTEPRWLAPVLATFVRALPRTFRDVEAPKGTTVSLRIGGASGGDWSVHRGDDRWELLAGPPARPPAAQVRIDQDVAWRAFTKGIDVPTAEARAQIEGDQELGRRALRTVSILA